jgi:hypothetical protein
MKIFGFEIKRDTDEVELSNTPSFVPPSDNDGALEITRGGVVNVNLDYKESYVNESELINKYRDMALHPDVDSAIDDIVNEALVYDDHEPPVKIVVDDVEASDELKDKIIEEFDNVLKLLNFGNKGYEIFRQWYVDGRLFYHAVIDITNPRLGMTEVRFIDPRKIRKVREIIEELERSNPSAGAGIVKKVIEYYIYNVRGPMGGTMGLKVAKDSIAYVNSGLTDHRTNMVLSFLHKAIKPLNQLNYLEDAAVIYRLARAPERRVFKIDVGNLPRHMAEAYMNDIINKYKTKLVYDPASGDVKDSRRQLSMLEDFWLPVREGRGTEIDTLEGGQQLGEMGDIDYFKKKLMKSLNVPISRLESETVFNTRATEITRDELKFADFVNRLRLQFSDLFDQLLEKQLILKGITTSKDWRTIKENIFYDFQRNNNFSEMMKLEQINMKLESLNSLGSTLGVFYSKAWVRKNVLFQTEEEIEQMKREMEMERSEDEDQGRDPNNPLGGTMPPQLPMGDPMLGMPPQPGQAGPETLTMGESTTKKQFKPLIISKTLTKEEKELAEKMAFSEFVKEVMTLTVEESSNGTGI